MSFNTILMTIIVCFSVLGGIDKLRGNPLGYGERFDTAFATLKSLAIIMIGSITLAPVLNVVLSPVLKPLYAFLGASPAMFAGTLFAIDSGAYPLALELSGGDPVLTGFSGIILGSTFGSLILGMIPISIGMLDREYHPLYARALIFSIITIPVGCILGGLSMNLTGYTLPFSTLLINLLPVLLVSVLLILALILIPEGIMRFFCRLGSFTEVLLTVSVILATVQFFTGLRLPLFDRMVLPGADGLSPLESSLIITGTIALLLTGALPLTLWISRTFQKPIRFLSPKIGMDEIGGTALIAVFTSYFPVLPMVPKMNEASRQILLAFATSGAFVLGDHLAYTASVCPDMILPMIVTKLSAGFAAAFCVRAFSRKTGK